MTEDVDMVVGRFAEATSFLVRRRRFVNAVEVVEVFRVAFASTADTSSLRLFRVDLVSSMAMDDEE